MELSPFFVVFIIYGVANLFYLMRLIMNLPVFSAMALRITMVGLTLHTYFFVRHFLIEGGSYVWGWQDFYQVSAWILGVIFVFLCFSRRFYLGGPLFLALVAFFMGLSFTHHETGIHWNVGRGQGFLLLHLLAIFCGLAVYAVSLVSLIMRALANFQLKQKGFGSLIDKFPSLDSLDRVYWSALQWGFLLLSFVLLTGAGFLKLTTGDYVTGGAKQNLTIVIWLMMAFVVNVVPFIKVLKDRVLGISLFMLILISILFVVGLR